MMLPGAEFPLIPVKPGIFPTVCQKRGFGTEKSKVDQWLTGKLIRL